MSIKIENNDPIWEEYAGYWQERNQKTIAWLRGRMRGFDYEIEETADIIMVKQMEKIRTGMYPRSKWDQLLGKIRKGCLIDFYRAQDRKQKKFIQSDVVNDLSTTIEKDTIKNTDNFQEKDIPYLRIISLSPHRSLHDAMLISLAPKWKELKAKIEEIFPAIIGRVRKSGIHFEVRYRREKEFSQKLQDEIYNFDELLVEMAKKLKIDDFIGRNALKILLLSEKPFVELALSAPKEKIKKYKTIKRAGGKIKCIDKKTIGRPYLYFLRDYFIAKGKTLRAIKQFIKYQAIEKYPDDKLKKEFGVEPEYVIRWYALGKINSETIKKQRFGRKNKSTGLLEKIKSYDATIEQFLLSL